MSTIRPNLFVVWMIVTVLWTTATVWRMRHLWVPTTGWASLMPNELAWISLLVPPVMFAIVLAAVRRLGGTGRRRHD
jgi:hypothetical protein